MELEPIFKFGLPAILVVVVGLLGRTRRVGFWGAFVLAIILTPIGGFLVALFSGPKQIVVPTPAGKANARPSVQPKKNGWFSRAA